MNALATRIAADLNRLHGSSASGMFVVVSVLTGDVGSHLFSFGDRPRLAAGERLVRVGGSWTVDDVEALV